MLIRGWLIPTEAINIMKIVKLDLHGIKHEDVNSKVIRFIEKNWDSGNELEIITGHSTKMKSIVIDILDEYKLEYNIGRISEINKACIIIWA